MAFSLLQWWLISLLNFVHIHSGVLTGGGDLSSLGGELMVGLMDMRGGSYKILTIVWC